MKIAAIIPCYNEELTIKQVICDIQKYCPKCEIYVFDNNSSDNSYNIAKETGAIVKKVMYQGKGEVVRNAFSIIDADIYILIDGDGECDASAIPSLIDYLINEDLDMITVIRKAGKYRRGHSFGNKMITTFAKILFGKNCNDILSGYRVFSKKFVKTFPANSRGFEIETELTIFALQMRLPIDEVSAKYIKRPEGSHSKLNTFKDGFKILFTIIYLLITEKPLLFFNTISLIFLVIGLFLGIGITIEYFETLKVERFPTAILTICLIILSALSFSIGLLMKAISKVLSENRRFKYNSVK